MTFWVWGLLFFAKIVCAKLLILKLYFSTIYQINFMIDLVKIQKNKKLNHWNIWDTFFNIELIKIIVWSIEFCEKMVVKSTWVDTQIMLRHYIVNITLAINVWQFLSFLAFNPITLTTWKRCFPQYLYLTEIKFFMHWTKELS